MIARRRGQSIIEAVLIITLFVFISTMVANYFRSSELLSKMLQGPWARLAGMIQNGQWRPPMASAAAHPSGAYRGISLKGRAPQ